MTTIREVHPFSSPQTLHMRVVFTNHREIVRPECWSSCVDVSERAMTLVCRKQESSRADEMDLK